MGRDTPTDPAIGADAVERAAADWLARRDGGDWNADDDAALEAWLAADVAHRVALLRLQAAWTQAGRLQALGAGWRGPLPPPRGHWASPSAETPAPPAGPDLRDVRFASRASVRAASRPRRAPVRAAAALAGMLAIAAVGFWHSGMPVDSRHYDSRPGSVRTLALADGSQTTLAGDSDITVRLSRRARRIGLARGEAIFDAARDPSRPFVVEASAHRVVAVGTRFSVRREDSGLRVVVTEGTVRLEPAAGIGGHRPSVLLPAGSVAVVRPDDVRVRTLPLTEAAQLLDWRNGLLVFRDTPLREAAAEFNRHNPRQILIADPEVGELRIGGTFRWANADSFVRLLEQGFPVRAEYAADRIVLHSP
ncbi:FecR domain-containing protein [Luteimonas sp. BDR2-5]|uniref:FecR family protein n=1 Tax=Proluteimonas luteida TaxID=2878685 RepID=UPI001E63E840|nr:FecR domain-containing protein [Luteimonas sp. BDR2-5]MCD9029124.1 FecR domain-containing protein [Luteimonas sp. BDR2-5]